MFLLPRIRIMWLYVSCILTLWGVSICFPNGCTNLHFYHRAWGLPFFISSPILAISCLFDDSHDNRCEVISHCGFDLHFLDVEGCWASLQASVGHLYDFLGQMSVQVCCPVFNHTVFLILSFMISSCNMDINPPLDICKYLFPFSSLPFCFVDVLNCTKVFHIDVVYKPYFKGVASILLLRKNLSLKIVLHL